MSLLLLCLSIYLFKTAPVVLDEEQSKQGVQLPVRVLFEVIAAENNVVRTLYTKQIVGKSKISGLKYSEDWSEEEVQAGPLPALFLRAVAQELEKNPVPVSLFLGSDFPISSANAFDGRQDEVFQGIKSTQQPAFFYADSTRRHVAMFPDYAIAAACVDCHNKHPDSPKTDWKLGDMMGATTWLYPDETVTLDEITKTVAVLRASFKKVYAGYLLKTQGFDSPPEVGDKWPGEGNYLPSVEVFFAVYDTQASEQTMRLLLANSVAL